MFKYYYSELIKVNNYHIVYINNVQKLQDIKYLAGRSPIKYILFSIVASLFNIDLFKEMKNISGYTGSSIVGLITIKKLPPFLKKIIFLIVTFMAFKYIPATIYSISPSLYYNIIEIIVKYNVKLIYIAVFFWYIFLILSFSLRLLLHTLFYYKLIELNKPALSKKVPQFLYNWITNIENWTTKRAINYYLCMIFVTTILTILAGFLGFFY